MISHHERDINAGASSADINLAQTLEKLGHNVRLFFYDDAFPERTFKGTWRQFFFPWATAFHFLKEHLKKPYNVVDTTAGDFWVTCLLLKILPIKKPLISVRTHGLEHIHAEVELQNIRKQGKKIKISTYLYHFKYRLLEVRKDLENADIIFFLNQEDANYAISELGINPKKIYIFPQGIPENYLNFENDVGIEDRLYNLIFLGSWIPRKGIDILAKAIEKIFSIDERFKLTCAGVQVERKEVLSYFPEGLWSRINVISNYKNNEFPDILKRHGILVFPSRAEGFGLAIAEAMALKLIVISTPVGIAPQLIQNGENGFLVPANNIDLIVETIMNV
ncbi:MAG: glycosyltransferase family 4 protein, partial [Elusimicrobiota bacterium]